MKIFVNTLIIIAFILVYCFLYFLLERWKKSDMIVKKNYSKLIMNFIEGTTYSAFGIITQLILFQTNQFAQPYIYIILGLTLSFLRNAVIACYSIIGSMLYSMFAYPLDDIFYYVIVIMFISMALTSLMKNFIKTKISILVNTAFILINIFVLWLVASLALNYNFNAQFILTTLAPFLLSILLILFISFLLNFFRSANLLYESSTYDVLKFYRESISEKIIQDSITINKISKGLFVILEFNWTQKESIYSKRLELQVLEKIQDEMQESSILFKANKEQYGFFMPIETKLDLGKSIHDNSILRRSKEDILKRVETLLLNINGEYEVEEFKNRLRARAGVVIYGVQEQNVDKMISFSEFALESSRWNNGWNNTTLFDPLLYKQKAADYIAITDMDESIGISSISNAFIPIYGLNEKETIMNVATPITTDVIDVEYDSLLKYSEYMGYKSILLSFNAAQALKATNGWHSSPILINYSFEKIMNDSFSVEDLFASIKRFKQSSKHVMLNFDYDEVKNYPITQINKKMRMLRVNGIKYSIFNLTIDDEFGMLSKIRPQFIFLDKTLYKSILNSKSNIKLIEEIVDFAKLIKSKVVVSDIEKERELSFILRTNIKYIGGPIFNRDKIEPLLFNKKSRIYIEQIQKETK